MTCLNHLKEWHRAGAWQRLHQVLLSELRGADKIDWSRGIVDASFARVLGSGEKTGPNPTYCRKPGSKHHVLTDGHGIPLATTLTSANTHEITQLLPLVDAVPPVGGKSGYPRRRPPRVHGDRSYDSEPHRRELRQRSIEPHLARRHTAHGSGLGVFRWVVERTLSWLRGFRKLRLRTDWRSEVQEAFLALACAVICLRFL